MKEIILNPDGVLNILDPRKTYVLEVNWTCCSDPNYSGKKYYLPKESDSGLEFRRVGTTSNFICTPTKFIQYLVEDVLTFLQRHPSNNWSNAHVYEFRSLEEFNNWRYNQ
jgi:hypothetical protein